MTIVLQKGYMIMNQAMLKGGKVENNVMGYTYKNNGKMIIWLHPNYEGRLDMFKDTIIDLFKESEDK